MSDPRGPRRTIVAAEQTLSHWNLTLNCGHIAHGTSHFWFEIGGSFHCLKCKDETR